MQLTPGPESYWIRDMTTSEGAEMEAQFFEGTVNLPVTVSETKAGLIRPSERRKTDRRYLVYLRGRTTAEVFYDYTGSYLAHQDRGGWVFYTKAPVAGEPIEKVWIPWHRIVSVEIVG